MPRRYNVRSYGGSGSGNKFMSGSNGHSPQHSLTRSSSGKATLKGTVKYSKGFRPAHAVGRGGTSKVLSHPRTSSSGRVGPGHQGKYKRVSSGGIKQSTVRVRAPKSSIYAKKSSVRTQRYRSAGTIQASRTKQTQFAQGIGSVALVGGGSLLAAGGAVGGTIAARHAIRRVKARRAASNARFRAGGGRGSFRDIRAGYRSGRGSGQKRDSRGRFA